MDKVIEATRGLGKALQADERYINYTVIQKANEEDTELQEMIAEFEAARAAVMAEAQKGAQKDADKIMELNNNVQDLYNKIFENQNMINFAESQNEMNELMNFINQIITGSFNGMDPETIEQSEGCSGSCSSCSGC